MAKDDVIPQSSVMGKPSRPHAQLPQVAAFDLPPSQAWEEPCQPSRRGDKAGQTGKFRARTSTQHAALRLCVQAMEKPTSSRLKKIISIIQFCAVGTISTSLL